LSANADGERAGTRKTRRAFSAHGFSAQQFILNKTPWLTGPVNRSSIFFSTDAAVARMSKAISGFGDPAPLEAASKITFGEKREMVVRVF
jgi:hypothetical protein